MKENVNTAAERLPRPPARCPLPPPTAAAAWPPTFVALLFSLPRSPSFLMVFCKREMLFGWQQSRRRMTGWLAGWLRFSGTNKRIGPSQQQTPHQGLLCPIFYKTRKRKIHGRQTNHKRCDWARSRRSAGEDPGANSKCSQRMCQLTLAACTRHSESTPVSSSPCTATPSPTRTRRRSHHRRSRAYLCPSVRAGAGGRRASPVPAAALPAAARLDKVEDDDELEAEGVLAPPLLLLLRP